MPRSIRPTALMFILVVLTTLTSCAAGDARFTAEAPAGFWLGLWHGAISCITLIIQIFSDTVRVYEVDNTGGWYDFGFLLGVTMFWGGSSKANPIRRRRARRDRDRDLCRED